MCLSGWKTHEISLKIFTEDAAWITVPVAKKLEVDFSANYFDIDNNI